MKITHPRKRDIIIFNISAIMGGLAFGDIGYIYTTMAMFFIYTVLSFFINVTADKASRLNYFLVGGFVLFNYSFFGITGLNLTIQSTINMYLLFMLIIPLGKIAKAKYKAHYSTKTTGENHE